ncbi:SAM-dependent methyltransferase [Cryptosporangium sp. NPDC051539]|uniref:SAM-dependent methyltransferase n=1 Tax=Cryptosporangium sp. NPDC051539 TaxID=3363962 RepID=UPI00378E3765
MHTNPRSRYLRDTAPELPRPGLVWDCLNGGTNRPDDRIMFNKLLIHLPRLRQDAKANTQFRHLAVLHLLSRGIRQFLDLGSGVPVWKRPLHNVITDADPDARILYVDHDEVVCERSRERIGTTASALALHANVTKPEGVFGSQEFADLFDPSQPLAILATNVFQHVSEADSPRRLLAAYRAECVPGSALVIAHPTAYDLTPSQTEPVTRLHREGDYPYIFRTTDEITALFEGYQILPGGLLSDQPEPRAVPIARWDTPAHRADPTLSALAHLFYGGVGILRRPEPDPEGGTQP